MPVIDVDDVAIEDMAHDPVGPVAEIMERYAYKVENAAKVELVHVGTGVEWPEVVRTRLRDAPRGTPGRLWMFGEPSGHRSSSPGEPPASDTGMLLASIHHIMREAPEGVGADIGTDLRVGEWSLGLLLELGTRYMDARPFLRPALFIGLAS